jgi:hypothetical protein
MRDETSRRDTDVEELTGIAALADRKVRGRPVAIVMACVAIAFGLACGAMAEHLLESANAEPAAAARLRSLPERSAFGPPGHAAVVLIDGMRVDEAERLASWRSLRAWKGQLSLPLPTLSRPFYHMLLTGIPPDGSGLRSNRFEQRARHDSVADRVRAAGGSVFIVADNLDWLSRMYGPVDGSTAAGSIDGPLDGWIARWRDAAAPSLLVVHATKTDSTAHASGIHSPAHHAELARADAMLARVAAADSDALFVLADHGHLARGGHGGPEPEVARAPIAWRARGARADSIVDPTRLAATISAALGVAAPRSACGDPLGQDDQSGAVARANVRLGRQIDRSALVSRRSWTMLVAFFAVLMTLGPIKRAYRLDRSVPIAMASFPLNVLALHAFVGLPLSMSAIDGTVTHSLRIASIGAVSALVAFALAYSAGSGDRVKRVRRAAASVGWSAWACAIWPTAWVGFALGPWPLDAIEMYVPLLACGASAAALATVAVLLFATMLARERTTA